MDMIIKIPVHGARCEILHWHDTFNQLQAVVKDTKAFIYPISLSGRCMNNHIELHRDELVAFAREILRQADGPNQKQVYNFDSESHKGTICVQPGPVGLVISVVIDGYERDIALLEVPSEDDPVLYVWDSIQTDDDLLVAHRFTVQGTQVNLNLMELVRQTKDTWVRPDYGNTCFKCGQSFAVHNGDGSCVEDNHE